MAATAEKKDEAVVTAGASRSSLNALRGGRRSTMSFGSTAREKDTPGLYRVKVTEGLDWKAYEGMQRYEAESFVVVVEVDTARVPGKSLGRIEGTDAWIPLFDESTQVASCEKVSMKEQVAMKLEKPVYNVQDFYHEEGVWQAIAKHPVFENLTLAVITVNACWLAIDADMNYAETLFEAKPHFQIAEHLFCIYFFFEWYCRFKSFRRKRDGLKDAWFVFDTCLVGMMVVETWVVNLIMVMIGGSGAGGGGVASLLRLLRLLRLSRLARMLRSMPELMILIKGIVAASRSVAVTISLLVIMMYIFAIAFRQLTMGSPIGDIYFKSIPASMYSLLMYGTFLEDMKDIVDDLGGENFVLPSIFFIFVLLSALTVLNMLIGILCEVVSDVASEEREGMLRDSVQTKMEAIMNEIDADGDGMVSKKEFRSILYKPEAARNLEETGVDAVNLIDYIDYIFDGEEGELNLTMSEFMDLVLKFRKTNVAKVKDTVDIRKFINSGFQRLDALIRLIPRSAPMPSEPSAEAKTGGTPPPRGPNHERSLRSVVPCFQRLDAFLTAVVADLGNVCDDLKPAPPELTGTVGGKRFDGSESPHLSIPGVPDCVTPLPSSSRGRGSKDTGANVRRLEQFVAMCLDELQQADAVLPIAPCIRAVGASGGEASEAPRQVRLWRATTEEVLLASALPSLARLAAGVAACSRIGGSGGDLDAASLLELEHCACELAEQLAGRRDELRVLCGGIRDLADGDFHE